MLFVSGVFVSDSWQQVREQVCLNADQVFLNSGMKGPLLRAVRDKQIQTLQTVSADPTFLEFSQLDAVKRSAAQFMGAPDEEVAITRSTTEGIRIFFHGIDLRAGDEVLACNHEYPSGTGSVKARGLKDGIVLKIVDLPEKLESKEQIVRAFESAITPRTRVLFVSHVIFTNGIRMPVKELAELAHKRGLLISVDGAQSVGMLDLQLSNLGIDHFAGPGQKWLLAGGGTGVFFLKKDIWAQMKRDVVYQDQVINANCFARFGQMHEGSHLGIKEAFDFHLQIGMKKIEQRICQLGQSFRRELAKIKSVKLYTPLAEDLSAGLTTFEILGVSNEKVKDELLAKKKIVVRTVPRAEMNACRVSTHVFNTETEIQNLLKILAEIRA